MEICEAGPSSACNNHDEHNNAPKEKTENECIGDELCWLCLYQHDDEAKRVMEFVVKSVGYIDIFNIATQVSTFIHTNYKAPQNDAGETVHLQGIFVLSCDKCLKNITHVCVHRS